MRAITDHHVTGAKAQPRVFAADEPGPGGADCHYQIHAELDSGHPAAPVCLCFVGAVDTRQDLTNEAILAVVIDRLRGFQSGKFACRENALALTRLEEALHWLQARTRARLERGVEGTQET